MPTTQARRPKPVALLYFAEFRHALVRAATVGNLALIDSITDVLAARGYCRARSSVHPALAGLAPQAGCRGAGMTRPRAPGQVRQMALQLAQRPAGMQSCELQALLADAAIQTTAGRISKLVRAGVLVALPCNGGTNRYFASQALADAWGRGAGGASGAGTGGGAVAAAGVRRRAPPLPHQKISFTAGPARIKPGFVGGVVVQGNVKHTIAPTPPGRFEPAPGYRGPFGLAGVWRDVETGQAWAGRPG